MHLISDTSGSLEFYFTSKTSFSLFLLLTMSHLWTFVLEFMDCTGCLKCFHRKRRAAPNVMSNTCVRINRNLSKGRTVKYTVSPLLDYTDKFSSLMKASKSRAVCRLQLRVEAEGRSVMTGAPTFAVQGLVGMFIWTPVTPPQSKVDTF